MFYVFRNPHSQVVFLYVTFCTCMFCKSATALMCVHLHLFGFRTSIACIAILLAIVHLLRYI
jgi:hypothetical protein